MALYKFTRQPVFVALCLLARAIFADTLVSRPQPAEASVTKPAEIQVDGHTLRYVATAGTIPIRNGAGEIEAEMFYVAYAVAAAPDAAPRPVTFALNGGPGSSSSPLLLAAIGPLRVHLDLPQPTSLTQAAAVTLSPNDATILDRTDLVFLDAVGTGYSHAVGKASDHDFAKAIIGWLGANYRWPSPVAIIGESYAGTRAAGLAPLLPRAGVQLRGVMLVSPGLSAPSLDLYSDTFFALNSVSFLLLY
jgi:carboxypeptidase C (cathepsin A)